MASTINTATINAAVTNALRTATSYAVHIEALKIALKGVERKDAQSIITQPIAKFYGVALIEDGQRGHTFDKEAKGYEAAKKARSRLLSAVYGGTTSARTEPAVKRFDAQRVGMLQDAITGLTKAQARSSALAM